MKLHAEIWVVTSHVEFEVYRCGLGPLRVDESRNDDAASSAFTIYFKHTGDFAQLRD